MSEYGERRAPEPVPGGAVQVGEIAPPLPEERRLTTTSWPLAHALEFVGGLAVGQGLLAIAGGASGKLIRDLVSVVASHFGRFAAGLVALAFVVALVSVPYIVMWVLIARSAKRRRITLAQLTGMRRPPLETIPLVVLFTFAALIAVAMWGAFVVQLGVKMPNPTYEIARALKRSPVTLSIIALLSVTLGPFVEELLFRGIVLPSMRRKWGTTWAVVGSAFLFSVIHFQPWSIPALFAVGVVLGLIYVQTRSLWASVALHSTYNFVVALIVYFTIVARA